MQQRPGTHRRADIPGAEHWIAGVVFLLVTIAFFGPAIFEGRSFTAVAQSEAHVLPWAADPAEPGAPFPVWVDQAVLSVPWQAASTDALQEPTLALWGKEFGGFPLFSNGASGQLYPPRLLLSWLGLSTAVAHDLFSALHVFAAGIATYGFLRRLDVGYLPAVFGGLAWMLGGFNMAWLHFEVLSPAMALLPIGLYLVQRAAAKEDALSWAVAGLGMGLGLISGQILFAALTTFVIGAYAGLGGLARAWSRRSAVPVFGPLFAAVVALGSSAVVLAPTYITLASSNRRALDYDELRDEWITGEGLLVRPSDLASAFMPTNEGLTVASLNNRTMFIGTATVLLAVIGLVRRRQGTGLGRTLVLTVGLVSIGGPVTWVAFHIFPLAQYFRPYGRALGLLSFGIVVLAVIGLDELCRTLDHRADDEASGGDIELFPAVGTTPWFHLTSTRVALVLIAVTGLQLFVYARDVNPSFADRDRLFERTALVESLEELQSDQAWPARAISISSTGGFAPLSFNLQDLFDIRSLDGYDSAVPTRTATMARYLSGLPFDEAREPLGIPLATVNHAAAVRTHLIERLGVRAIVSEPGAIIPWPGADGESGSTVHYDGEDGTITVPDDGGSGAITFVDGAVVVQDADEAFMTFTDPEFDWKNLAVIEASDADRFPQVHDLGNGDGDGRASIREVRGGINSAELTVEATGPGLLLIPENFDGGWSATVNGDKSGTLRANYVQQAVPVPSGLSRVELRYLPEGLRSGAFVTLATLAMIAVLATWTRWTTRARGRHMSRWWQR